MESAPGLIGSQLRHWLPWTHSLDLVQKKKKNLSVEADPAAPLGCGTVLKRELELTLLPFFFAGTFPTIVTLQQQCSLLRGRLH